MQFEPIYLGPKKFMCPLCNRIMSQKRALEDHIRIHTGDNPYACQFCEHTCKKESNLRRHIAKCHRSNRFAV